jgi:cytochrome b pre-mRNA-processing protein 3
MPTRQNGPMRRFCSISVRRFSIQRYGVPDSFDGRFDLLLIHLFLVINRLANEGEQAREFNQALFDVTFADMDQTLREMGIGDMGVPKHQRRMMKGFNGRMHAYDEALKQGEGAFAIALRRNLYGTIEDTEVPDIQKIMRYIRESMAVMAQKPVSGDIERRGRLCAAGAEMTRKKQDITAHLNGRILWKPRRSATRP